MNDFTPQKQPQARPDISMMEATANAYVFVKSHYHTLLKWAVVPIVLGFFSYIVIDWQEVGDNRLNTFLYGLPATATFAWYVFVQTRLQVMGEFAGQLPLDDHYADQRRDDMKASICCYILFQMAMALITFGLSQRLEMPEGRENVSPDQMIIVTAGLIIMFWMLKYGLLHLVTAVGGSIKGYLKRVQGSWFSFLLIGVGFVSTLPVLLIFMFALSLVAPAATGDDLQTTARFGLYAIGTIMSWAVITVLNAALVDVLRQLYKGTKK